MNRPIVASLLIVSAMTFALGAAPPVQPKRKVPAPVPRPVVRQAVRLGAAPKAQVKVNNRTITIDPKSAAVKAVRAIPPTMAQPAARKQAVAQFYQKAVPNKTPTQTQLATYIVGPYRPYFVWWAYENWQLGDRAWWAWNNRSYFDNVLWAQWMADAKFAALVNGYNANVKQVQPTLGLVPAKYALTPAEDMYNDDYIQAVYNPVPTDAEPSIIVDASHGPRLENLVDTAPRTFDRQTLKIKHVADAVSGFQFLSTPAGIDQTYKIRVNRDGILYVFGPNQTPLSEGAGDDASRWQKAGSSLISGAGIEIVYSRKVTAGETIRIHGREWSVAAEQIQVLNPASRQAKNKVRLAGNSLVEMVKSTEGLDKNVKASLQTAQDTTAGIITALDNVDDNQLSLFYSALSQAEQSSIAVAKRSKDAKVTAAAKDIIAQVLDLKQTFGELQELRNPDGQGVEAASEPAALDKATPDTAADISTCFPVGSTWTGTSVGGEPLTGKVVKLEDSTATIEVINVRGTYSIELQVIDNSVHISSLRKIAGGDVVFTDVKMSTDTITDLAAANTFKLAGTLDCNGNTLSGAIELKRDISDAAATD